MQQRQLYNTIVQSAKNRRVIVGKDNNGVSYLLTLLYYIEHYRSCWIYSRECVKAKATLSIDVD